ncbi:MAG: hypothetical protein R3E64_04070 [Halioglobus sp.]
MGMNFETIWGRYSSGGMITELELRSSSNGGERVEWAPGSRLVEAVATADQLATMGNKVETEEYKIFKRDERIALRNKR